MIVGFRFQFTYSKSPDWMDIFFFRSQIKQIECENDNAENIYKQFRVRIFDTFFMFQFNVKNYERKKNSQLDYIYSILPTKMPISTSAIEFALRWRIWLCKCGHNVCERFLCHRSVNREYDESAACLPYPFYLIIFISFSIFNPPNYAAMQEEKFDLLLK